MTGFPPWRPSIAPGKAGAVFTPYSASFPTGSYSWEVPEDGVYAFPAWGGGGTGSGTGSGSVGGGGGGAFILAERMLYRGQIVAITTGDQASDTVITLPSGEVLIAGGGANGPSGAGGVAVGGDKDIKRNGGVGGNNSAGSAGQGTGAGAGGVPGVGGGGGGAAGELPYRGGPGAGTSVVGGYPGGGAGGHSATATQGAQGLTLVTRVS